MTEASFFQSLASDLRAGDGRAVSIAGALRRAMLDPSFNTILRHRLASRVMAIRRMRALGRLLYIWNTSRTACHISPWAQVGPGVFFPHPTGIVIGEGVVIETGCTIYQNVTLGRSAKEVPGYPHIGPGVTIYAGAVVAGAVHVGQGAVIGANAVVIRDVPANHVACGVPAVNRMRLQPDRMASNNGVLACAGER